MRFSRRRHQTDPPPPAPRAALLEPLEARWLLSAVFGTGSFPVGPAALVGDIPSDHPVFVTPIAGEQGVDWGVSFYADRPFKFKDYLEGPIRYPGHEGVDFALSGFEAMDRGVAVLAAAAGTVVEVHDGEFDRNTANDPGRPANYVRLDHGGGWETYYYHFREQTILVAPFDAVEAGQPMGLVGSSGDSSGPHVHFEVRYNGEPVDPFEPGTEFWATPPVYQGQTPQVLDSGITSFVPTGPEIYEGPPRVGFLTPQMGDRAVYWASVAGLEAEDDVYVRFYAPSGGMYADVQMTASFEGGIQTWYGYIELFSTTPSGQWTARLFANGVAIDEETFTIGSQSAHELKVSHDDAYLVDGRTTPVEFVGPPGTPVRKTFLVENVGGGLSTSVQLPPGFTLVEGLTSYLIRDESDTFTVEFDPSVVGLREGDIRITSYGSEFDPYTFAVRGRGVGGGPELTIPGVRHGGVAASWNGTAIGNTVTNPGSIMLTLRNEGQDPLHVWLEDLPDFAFTTFDMVQLAPGESTRVEFSVGGPGDLRGEIVLGSNDADEGTFRFEIAAEEPDGPLLRVYPFFDFDVNGGPLIAPGDTTPREFDHTLMHGGAQFYLFNEGSEPLEISGFSVSGPFELFSSQNVIAPGEFGWVEVTAMLGDPGVYEGSLTIRSNDPAHPSYSFALVHQSRFDWPLSVTSGTGAAIIPGVTDVSHEAGTDFGVVEANTRGQALGFVLHASDRIELTSVELPAGFRFDWASPVGWLEPGQSRVLRIVMDTATPATRSGEVRLKFGVAPDFTFPIRGRVIAEPRPGMQVLYQGAAVADGDSTPSAIEGTDFGVVPPGGATIERTFTVRNTGDGPLSWYFKPTPNGFSGSRTLGDTFVPAGESRTLRVRFTPTTEGVFTGDLVLGNNVAGIGDYTFALKGVVGQPAPDITVAGNGTAIADGDTAPAASDHTDFGSVVLGQTGPTRVFTVTNPGSATLTLGTPTLPAGYTLVEPLGATLAPGASDTFSVRLATAAVGEKSGQISIATNVAGQNPFNFAITGSVSPTPADVAVTGNGVTITDGDATPAGGDHTDFGSVPRFGTGPTRTFTVTNTGGSPLTLGAVSVPAGFTLIEPLGATLAPGASDTFTVRLDSAAEGTKAGQISFATNAAGKDPFNFSIRGTVSAALPAGIDVRGDGEAILDGDTTPRGEDLTDFGTVLVGQATLSRSYLVSNTGGSPLTLGAVSVPSGFTLVNTLPATLAPGESGVITVELPTAVAGVRSGFVSFGTNVPGRNPFNFWITGTVQAPAPAAIEVRGGGVVIADGDTTPQAADLTDFGTVNQHQLDVAKTFAIKNTGGSPLNLGGVSVPAGFTLIDPPPSVLAPGETASFSVALDTDTPGTRTGQISFTTNAAGKSPFNFSITATVLAAPQELPGIAVEGGGQAIVDGDTTPSVGDGTSFGSVPEGAAAVEREFAVTNTGTATLTLGAVSLPAGFELVDPMPSELPAGQSDTFRVRMPAGAAGAFSGEVSFTTNVAGASVYNFAIAGSVTPVVVGAPELEVTGKGLAIADGDTSPSTADGTDMGFGSRFIVASAAFVVRNLGTEALHVSLFEILGPFALLSPTQPIGPTNGLVVLPSAEAFFPETIGPGESVEIVVACDTVELGVHDGTLRIVSDDADEGVYEFKLRAENVAPQVEVTGGQGGAAIDNGGTDPSADNGTDFGGVSPADGQVTHAFTLRNAAAAGLSLRALSPVVISGDGADGFEVTLAPPAEIQAGQSVQFQIRFDPRRPGAHEATVSVMGPDGDALFEFAIGGQGVVTFGTIGGKRVKATLADATGVPVTLSLSGAGTGSVSQGPEGLGVVLSGTTIASALTITTPKGTDTRLAKLTADQPLKSVTAKTADLVGEARLLGGAAAITFDDWVGAALVLGGSAADAPVTLKLDLVAGGAIESARPIKSITAVEWLDAGGEHGRIAAPSVAGLTIKGDKKRGVRGDFEADVQTSDTATELKKLTVAGLMRGARVQTAGALKSATVGAMEGARLFAGVIAPGDALPDDAADFNGAALGAVTIKGLVSLDGASFALSSLAATNIGTVKLKDVDAGDGAGEDFGLAARTIKTFQRLDQGGLVKLSNLDTPGDADSNPADDFVIRVL